MNHRLGMRHGNNRRMRLQGHPRERVITGDGTAVMQEAGREM